MIEDKIQNRDLKENEFDLPVSDNDITLSELILIFNEYIQALLTRRWWIIKKGIIFSLFGIVIFFAKNFISPKSIVVDKKTITYTSIIEFAAKEHSISELGEITTKNISFGEIWKLNDNSEVFDAAILQKIRHEGQEDFIANILIEKYGLEKIWSREEISEDLKEYDLDGFRFTHSNINSFNSKELRALLLIRNLILGTKIRDISFNEYKKQQENKIRIRNMVETSKGKFLPEPEIQPTIGSDYSLLKVYGGSIDVTTKDKILSNKLANAFYEELKKLYFRRTDEITKLTLKKLKETEGSAIIELSEAEEKFDKDLEKLQKERTRIVQDLLKSQLQLAPELLLSKDIMLDYAQSSAEFKAKEDLNKEIKNTFETIEYNLKNKTTEFQILNQNFIPIKNTPPSRFSRILSDGFLQYMGIGLLVGMILSILYVLYSKMVVEATKNVQKI